MNQSSHIAIDTNILVRVITGDDEIQSSLAEALITKIESEKGTIYLTSIVIIETLWVLQRLYDASKKELLELLDKLMMSPTYRFEKRDIIQQAIDLYRQAKIGFADAVIIASCQAVAVPVFTFDKQASQSGMTLLSH